MPEISVLMGIYNENRKNAAQAIDSVLNQTFSDFEFIICDDGSEAEFYEWLNNFCRKDVRIKLLRNKTNMGLAAALNRCLKHSKGVYIARMDADDLSKKQRLEKQHAFLKRHQSYALVGSCVKLFDIHGVWGIRRLEKKPDKKSFLKTSPFIHPSVMMRREVMIKLHGYCTQKTAQRVEDYDFFMRLYAGGWRGYNLQEILLWYREDMNSYKKRKYRYRINECKIRWKGFWQLGILKGNLRYVIKPLAVGLVPVEMMRWIKKIRYGLWVPTL